MAREGWLSGISAGPDENLWFTYQDFTTNANAIGRMTSSMFLQALPLITLAEAGVVADEVAVASDHYVIRICS